MQIWWVLSKLNWGLPWIHLSLTSVVMGLATDQQDPTRRALSLALYGHQTAPPNPTAGSRFCNCPYGCNFSEVKSNTEASPDQKVSREMFGVGRVTGVASLVFTAKIRPKTESIQYRLCMVCILHTARSWTKHLWWSGTNNTLPGSPRHRALRLCNDPRWGKQPFCVLLTKIDNLAKFCHILLTFVDNLLSQLQMLYLGLSCLAPKGWHLTQVWSCLLLAVSLKYNRHVSIHIIQFYTCIISCLFWCL